MNQPSPTKRNRDGVNGLTCWGRTTNDLIWCANLQGTILEANRPATDVVFRVYLMYGEPDGTVVTLDSLSYPEVRLRSWAAVQDNVATFRDLCAVTSETEGRYIDLSIRVHSQPERLAECFKIAFVTGLSRRSPSQQQHERERSVLATSCTNLDYRLTNNAATALPSRSDTENLAAVASLECGLEMKASFCPLKSMERYLDKQCRFATSTGTELPLKADNETDRLEPRQPCLVERSSSGPEKHRHDESKGGIGQCNDYGDMVVVEGVGASDRRTNKKPEYYPHSTSAQDDCLPSERCIRSIAQMEEEMRQFLQEQQHKMKQRSELQTTPSSSQKLNLPHKNLSDLMVELMNGISLKEDIRLAHNKRELMIESLKSPSIDQLLWQPREDPELEDALVEARDARKQRRSLALSKCEPLNPLSSDKLNFKPLENPEQSIESMSATQSFKENHSLAQNLHDQTVERLGLASARKVKVTTATCDPFNCSETAGASEEATISRQRTNAITENRPSRER